MSSSVAGDVEYEEVDVNSMKDFDVTENVCYGDRLHKAKHDKESTSGGIKKHAIILSVSVAVLAFGLVAVCTGFAVEIKYLRNEIGSVTAQMQILQVSSQLDNVTMQMTALNQNFSEALDTVSDRLDNITVQDYSGRIQQLATINSMSYQQLSENISILETFLNLGKYQASPALSCAALPPSSPSGYYWVRASDGSAVRVYCDMTRSRGGVTGGWMRVAQLDMTNTSHQCPSPLRESNQSNIRTCVRNESEGGCTSIMFTTSNINYGRMCGKVIAYQHGQPEAFRTGNNNIESHYVDGVSLTYGTPRQHIWTFAVARDELDELTSCPCIRPDRVSREAAQIPSFVGENYFCDTGSQNIAEQTFYIDDPLWDGAGCGSESTCCSFNTPPWFYRQLPHTTTDDIEMRLCRDSVTNNEDIAIETIDLYVN